MFRRIAMVVLVGALLFLGAACHHSKTANPLSQVDSKQPDKVLFDKAMDSMQHGKYETARLGLQTLINTYPDSEYIARSKMAIGDSWLAEGGSAGLAQAESEYKDFITFFPNMPEAAEAQYKIADIHYKQIEKPDRDYTHALRAEEEYRQVILQYPDSKLAAPSRLRLLQVQEILAERQARIGRFYYLRESWPAAIARLKSLTDTYPLYSKADEALFMLGDADEHEAQYLRGSKMPEKAKTKLVQEFTDGATAAYSQIVTRYPVMPRAADAKRRLAAMNRPIPTPTQEAIEQNKREEASRGELGHLGRLALSWHKRPDYMPAAKVGEPTLVDPKQTDAAQIVREANDVLRSAQPGSGGDKVTVEPVKGAPAENQPVPRTPPAENAAPAASQDSPTAAPPQVNEANASDPSQPSASAGPTSGTATSSSRQEKKTWLQKLNPF